MDWWNTFESTFSANTSVIPQIKPLKSNTGDYIIDLELATDKHCDVKIKNRKFGCERNSMDTVVLFHQQEILN